MVMDTVTAMVTLGTVVDIGVIILGMVVDTGVVITLLIILDGVILATQVIILHITQAILDTDHHIMEIQLMAKEVMLVID